MKLLSILHRFLLAVGGALLLATAVTAAGAPLTVQVCIVAKAVGTTFPHFRGTTNTPVESRKAGQLVAPEPVELR